MAVDFLEDQGICPLVRCLSLLQNLHTLEIGSSYYGFDTTLLEKALGRMILPQMKTLIMPESAHPLLKHCPNVEDVVWVIEARFRVTSDEFLESLTSNSNSKVERLTVPLILPDDSSRKQSSALSCHETRTVADRLQL